MDCVNVFVCLHWFCQMFFSGKREFFLQTFAKRLLIEGHQIVCVFSLMLYGF